MFVLNCCFVWQKETLLSVGLLHLSAHLLVALSVCVCVCLRVCVPFSHLDMSMWGQMALTVGLPLAPRPPLKPPPQREVTHTQRHTQKDFPAVYTPRELCDSSATISKRGTAPPTLCVFIPHSEVGNHSHLYSTGTIPVQQRFFKKEQTRSIHKNTDICVCV